MTVSLYNIFPDVICTVLTYRHELGMNYNFIRPDLIVGSCLQVILSYILKVESTCYCFDSRIL